MSNPPNILLKRTPGSLAGQHPKFLLTAYIMLLQRLLAAFVAAWREVKAAQEAKAAEEAALFKTKTRSTDIATEEVRRVKDLGYLERNHLAACCLARRLHM